MKPDLRFSDWIKTHLGIEDENAIALINSQLEGQEALQEQYNFRVQVSRIDAIGVRRFSSQFLEVVCDHFRCQTGVLVTPENHYLACHPPGIGTEGTLSTKQFSYLLRKKDIVQRKEELFLPISITFAGADRILGGMLLTRSKGKRFEPKEANSLQKLCDLTAPFLHYRLMLDESKLMSTLLYHSLIEFGKAKRAYDHYLQLYRLDKGRELWEWDIIGITLIDLCQVIRDRAPIDDALHQRIGQSLSNLCEELRQVLSELPRIVAAIHEGETAQVHEIIAANPTLSSLRRETEFLKQVDPNFIAMKMLGIVSRKNLMSDLDKVRNRQIDWLQDVYEIVRLHDVINVQLFSCGVVNDATLVAYATATYCDGVVDAGNEGFSGKAEVFGAILKRLEKEYEIDSGSKIEETLKELASIEPIMYWGIKRYRDHLLHSSRMALLGLWVLEQQITIESACPCERECGQRPYLEFETPQTLERYVERLLQERVVASVTDSEKVPTLERATVFEIDQNYSYLLWKPHIAKIVRRIWLIASLKHDIGYAFTYLVNLYRKTRLMRGTASHSISRVREIIDRAFEQTFDLVRTHATSIDSTLYELNAKTLPHGAIGAFHVRHSMEDEYVREVAAKAIARHDDDTREVCFLKEPVSYLLILLDELQEWGRPVYTTHDSNYLDLRVLAQKLLAEDELLSIIWKSEDGELSFHIDYGPCEATLQRTGFSFPHFFYFKQRNFSRLVNGPQFSVHVKLPIFARRALTEFRDMAKRMRHTVTADWADSITGCDEIVFDLGRNKTGSLSVKRPPEAVGAVLREIVQ